MLHATVDIASRPTEPKMAPKELDSPHHHALCSHSGQPLQDNQSWKFTRYLRRDVRKVRYISIRNETGRYIRYKDGQEEFYDTNKDPHQWTNMIDHPEYAPVINKMRAAIPSSSDAATPLPEVLSNPRE